MKSNMLKFKENLPTNVTVNIFNEENEKR